jgi:hypothetical protein
MAPRIPTRATFDTTPTLAMDMDASQQHWIKNSEANNGSQLLLQHLA